jgi:hypothetical protein
MRSALLGLGMLALSSVGVVACSDAPSITTTPLGYTIQEGLMVLSENDPTIGTVIFAANTGNCKLFQAGATPTQILLSDFLTFSLGVQDSNQGSLPLTSGTYNIIIPPLPTAAGLYATSTEYETDAECDYSPTGANSGTITLQPFDPDAGSGSNASFAVVFGYDQFVGGYGLTTCVIPAGTPALDAGTCLLPGTLL